MNIHCTVEMEVLNREVLRKAGDWFIDVVLENHKKNTKKLSDISEFQINPMLHPYLATFMEGEITPRSLATALVYPRVLGTSITTSFGTNIQKFISDVLADAYGSLASGIDIEFIDRVDQQTRFCQLKLGPNTINKGDIKGIHDELQGVRNLARTNGRRLYEDSLVIGVMYGSEDDLSQHYKVLRDVHRYPIYVGQDFWHRLTGDAFFFHKLIATVSARVTAEVNGSALMNDVIDRLSNSPELIKMAADLSVKDL